jgi:hypothetical protein
MTFNQWWGSLKWSFAARILFKPIGQLFSEIAWNAAVRAEREACAQVCDEFESDTDPDAGAILAAAIRARGQE